MVTVYPQRDVRRLCRVALESENAFARLMNRTKIFGHFLKNYPTELGIHSLFEAAKENPGESDD